MTRARPKTSRFRGVSWSAKHECWRAEVSVKRRNLGIGHFDDESEAARAHDRVAFHYFRNSARLNFPRELPRPAPLETVRAEVRARTKRSTSSRFVGVSRDPTRKERPWFAMVTVGRKGLPIGRFRTEREAAIAHDRAALFYRPKRLVLNFPRLAKKLAPVSVDDLANELLRTVKKKTKSRFLGVVWNGHSWQATISVKDRNVYLGSFEVEEEAAQAYDRAALRHRGKRTKLNFHPDTGQELVGRV